MTDCVEWSGAKTKKGYGIVHANGRHTTAHRAAMEAHLGRRLGRFEYVCHKCDNPSCVLIEHLFLGTPKENTHDMLRKGRGNFTKTAEHRASLASALAGRAQPRAGEKSPQSKLSDDDCIAILQSGDPQVTLAKRFGVSTRLIRAVRSHKTRPHLAALREPSDA